MGTFDHRRIEVGSDSDSENCIAFGETVQSKQAAENAFTQCAVECHGRLSVPVSRAYIRSSVV